MGSVNNRTDISKFPIFLSCEIPKTMIVHPKKYAYGLYFVVLYCGYILVHFTHILQGYFTGTGAILWLP